MKRLVVLFGAVVALTSLCSLFGCSGQEESKTKTSVPGGEAAGGAAVPGKKGQPPMPGP